MGYIKKNKEVFVIIGVMIVFALFIGGYFLFMDKDSANTNNNNNNNNDNNNNNNGFNDDIEVVNKFLKCENIKNTNNSIIYTHEECIIKDPSGKQYKLRLPQINLNSVDINSVNKALRDEYESDKRLIEIGDDESLMATGLFDYIYYKNGDIISILLKRDYIHFYSEKLLPSYKIYNIDVVNKKIISNDELITYKKINISDKIPSIQSVVKEIYLNKMGYNLDVDDSDYTVESYFNSLNRVVNKEVFIDNNGKLLLILDLPIPEWSGSYSYIIEVGDNYVSYREMPL